MAARKMQLIVTESLDWMERGACVGADQDKWFVEEHSRGRYARRMSPDTIEAKRICNEECEVRDECREYALDTNQPYGVWGGLDEAERYEIKRRAAR
jgi:WhiB family redox-sensing transcriptional regulator